ncbi:tyrosine-type recombinase/integrase [Paucibacter sp. M5-1]|uniref:tyrosine-type recombinase/integrase n=1 Tax=Paucibacter sp. M5-1 TaxID=3015998 RepID=UPI0022B8C13E|nr:site-specific integrase [Paucibacter sp. M5-1]MCZ7884610.1 site-specific integrase [Paucibacter sp. M5-1]
MTLTDGFDIWAPLHPSAANELKSEVFARRANALLTDALAQAPNHPIIMRGRVYRKRLSQAIGCGPSTVNQNADIRKLVNEADLQLRDSKILESASALRKQMGRLYVPADNDAPLRMTAAVYLIVTTTNEFEIAGRPYPDIPTIIFANGIQEQASNWLRTIRVDYGLEAGSVGQYAKMLRPFLYDLKKRNIELCDITDGHLVEWRNKLEMQSAWKRANANNSILIIFQFLVWCEQNGELTYRVGCYERAALPEALRATQFPISAYMIFNKTGPAKWTTPLLFRTVPDSAGNRGTPNEEEMKELHRIAERLKHSRRLTTILTIVESTGARLFEILQLKISDIPDIDLIYKLLGEDNSKYEIEVIRKGGKPKPLHFDAEALILLHSYLKFREEIIKGYKKGHPDYKPPTHIFISEKTGKVLQRDSISKSVRKLAKAIGLKKIGIHRVRAKFAIDTIDRILDIYLKMGVQFDPGSGWIETILQQAAAEMGHGSVHSLRYYLQAALERRMRSAARVASRPSKGLQEKSDEEDAQTQVVRSMLDLMDEAVTKEAASAMRNSTDFA